MKHLLTISALLVSSLAMGQWPSLPYNPDDNADGLIGVADLQALLANYGSEFASAVVSEDGESAIVYMGEMGYFECEHSCNQLPGFWTLPNVADLVPVMSELNATTQTETWINKQDFDRGTWNRSPLYIGNSDVGSRYVSETAFWAYDKNCYCAAKQLPRVEYSYCLADSYISNTPGVSSQAAAFQSCCDEKVQDGWYPLGGLSKGMSSDGGQSFWRWAE